ncbi:DUF1801 domain-containing protein [Mesorhizobium sp. CAU 1741]|uniref:DUF1801 domain-containing protein n=1 Tax=Mesorhizobium sp. CAU 1741 TaxID=3140366 RepID=UPI00325B37BE
MSTELPETPLVPDGAITTVFDGYPEATRRALLGLRRLIYETAAETKGVGPIEEALKWGQPSYLTSKSKSGSTIRLGTPKDGDETVAIFFHCQTNLVSTFRSLYPDRFAFDGNRAIHVSVHADMFSAELKHCISLALTYHSRKKVEP